MAYGHPVNPNLAHLINQQADGVSLDSDVVQIGARWKGLWHSVDQHITHTHPQKKKKKKKKNSNRPTQLIDL